LVISIDLKTPRFYGTCSQIERSELQLSKKEPAMRATKTPAMTEISRSEELRPVIQSISGSDDFDFCITLLTQVVNAQWRPDSAELTQQVEATRAAMMGMKPRDALEGMLIGQLIAIHNAAMECCRRAMIPGQTFEGGREALNQANKLSRTYALLTEALDRHRGKGQQHIRVEHVNVHAGGQAIVGAVTPGGGSR
jgi:hypothetical protein